MPVATGLYLMWLVLTGLQGYRLTESPHLAPPLFVSFVTDQELFIVLLNGSIFLTILFARRLVRQHRH